MMTDWKWQASCAETGKKAGKKTGKEGESGEATIIADRDRALAAGQARRRCANARKRCCPSIKPLQRQNFAHAAVSRCEKNPWSSALWLSESGN